MDKCREAFEAKYRELHPNDKCTLMANGNYSGWIKQAHWWAWQSRQAELDQQKLLTLDSELHLDAAKEEIERLKGVVDKALNLINNWWHPNVDQKLFIEDVSKALKGKEQYAQHRTQAEQQINKGARLTNHQIDLGANNANS